MSGLPRRSSAIFKQFDSFTEEDDQDLRDIFLWDDFQNNYDDGPGNNTNPAGSANPAPVGGVPPRVETSNTNITTTTDNNHTPLPPSHNPTPVSLNAAQEPPPPPPMAAPAPITSHATAPRENGNQSNGTSHPEQKGMLPPATTTTTTYAAANNSAAASSAATTYGPSNTNSAGVFDMNTLMATNQAAFFQELARKINTAAAAAQLDATALQQQHQQLVQQQQLQQSQLQQLLTQSGAMLVQQNGVLTLVNNPNPYSVQPTVVRNTPQPSQEATAAASISKEDPQPQQQQQQQPQPQRQPATATQPQALYNNPAYSIPVVDGYAAALDPQQRLLYLQLQQQQQQQAQQAQSVPAAHPIYSNVGYKEVLLQQQRQIYAAAPAPEPAQLTATDSQPLYPNNSPNLLPVPTVSPPQAQAQPQQQPFAKPQEKAENPPVPTSTAPAPAPASTAPAAVLCSEQAQVANATNYPLHLQPPMPIRTAAPTQIDPSKKRKPSHPLQDYLMNMCVPNTTTRTEPSKNNVVSSSDTDGESVRPPSVLAQMNSKKKPRLFDNNKLNTPASTSSYPSNQTSHYPLNQSVSDVNCTTATSSMTTSVTATSSKFAGINSLENYSAANFGGADTDDTLATPSAIQSSESLITTDNSNNCEDIHLTEAQRVLANRLRNREHARNTRLRKKAYLENLKATLDELCRERDILVSERANAASMLLEMQRTRTDVLLSFFALRAENEKQRHLWSSILAESFTCVMPVTPYRSFPASEVQVYKCQRTILGVDGIMADTSSLHVSLNCLVNREKYPDAQIKFKYTIVAEESVVAGNQMMARWNMTTTNATKFGIQREIGKHGGMLNVRFNKAHKIVSMEIMFDVMAFMIQLKQHSEYTDLAVVPNTVQTCKGPFNVPIVMTTAERPYTIVQVNRLWEEMTGWKAEDVVGKSSCAILQGEKTNPRELEKLMYAVRFKHPVFVALTNHARGNQRVFRHHITVYPLSTDSKITHLVAFSVNVKYLQNNQQTHEGEKAVMCHSNHPSNISSDHQTNPKSNETSSGSSNNHTNNNHTQQNPPPASQPQKQKKQNSMEDQEKPLFANTDLSSLTSSISSISGKASAESSTSSRSIGTIPIGTIPTT